MLKHLKHIVFGGASNELTKDVYKRWFIYQMRVAQAALVLSFVSFISGSIYLMYGDYLIHGRLMLSGLILFYIGIMFSQHPGFTRIMPSPFASLLIGALTITWFITYVVNLWFNYAVGLALVTYYILLLIYRGLGKMPLYWPNIFFLSGLISLGLAMYMGGSRLVVFPIASIVSLIRRVEGRQRPNYVIDILYSASLPIITYFLNYQISLALLSLLTLMVIGIPRRFGQAFKTVYSRAYPIGSSLGRASLIIVLIISLVGIPTIDVFHMLFLGFIAVIMSSLCIPMLIPGILWFSMRFYGMFDYEIPIILFISALARTFYFVNEQFLIAISVILVIIAYVEIAISYLSGSRIKVL